MITIVGWMPWPQYQMLMNEHPHGGFKWEFLDFKPTRDEHKDFNTPIFISPRNPSNEIAKLTKAVEMMRECVDYYGDEKNWYSVNGRDESKPELKMVIASVDTEGSKWIGGKKARDTRRAVDELLKGSGK